MAIWTGEVARRLAARADVAVCSHGERFSSRVQRHEGVEYRFVPRGVDHRLRQAVEPVVDRLRPASRPYFTSILFHPAYWAGVARDLRRRRPDVVHIQMFSQLIPYLRRLLPETRIVLHMHWEWLHLLDRGMIDRRVRDADLVLACSEDLTNKTRAAFPHLAARCRTVYNGVDLRAFHDGAADEAGGERPLRLLFVGRISPEKGLHVLIPAFERVVERRPDVRLDIVGGEGTPPKEVFALRQDRRVQSVAGFYEGANVYESYLARIKRQMSAPVAERVRFVGAVPHDRIGPYFADADILVNSSLDDNFPMPVVEGMAAGLPVVAPRIGGLPEAIEHGETGLLIEPEDPGGLAAALLELLDDDGRRRAMGRAAHRRAAEVFSWERITDELVGLYDEVLAAPSHRGSR